MAESEAINTAVTQVAFLAATMAVMTLREVDVGPTSGASMASVGEACRYRHDRPALRQPSFDCSGPDKYVALLSFQIKVTNILQTKTHELNDEWKVLTKNWLGREGLYLKQTSTNAKKEACKTAEGLFVTLCITV